MNEENKGFRERSMDSEPLLCKSCGSPDVEDGYTLALCRNCREELSKRPIPKTIKAVAAGIILIAIILMIASLPKFKSAIEYEKGIKAEKSKKYVTAMKHYERVVKDNPNYDEGLVKLLSVYYENEKIDELYQTFKTLAGPVPEEKEMDNNLVEKVNEIMDKVDKYYNMSDALYEKLSGMNDPTPTDIINTIKPVVDSDPNEVYGAYYLANAYYEVGKFKEANDVLNKAIITYPNFYSMLLLQAATLRELGEYDKAIECTQKVLDHNVEDISAIVAKSKIDLKRKNNEKGLEYAKQAYDLDGSDSFVVSNLSLAYHYNNMTEDRDKAFREYCDFENKDEYTTNLLNSIFDGSLEWQK